MDSLLRPVNFDTLVLTAIASKRIPMVVPAYSRRVAMGKSLPISAAQSDVLQTIGTLHRRFSKGDCRISTYEASQLLEAARLLIVMHNENQGISQRAVTFSDNMFQKTELPIGSYGKALSMAAAGQFG